MKMTAVIFLNIYQTKIFMKNWKSKALLKKIKESKKIQAKIRNQKRSLRNKYKWSQINNRSFNCTNINLQMTSAIISATLWITHSKHWVPKKYHRDDWYFDYVVSFINQSFRNYNSSGIHASSLYFIDIITNYII